MKTFIKSNLTLRDISYPVYQFYGTNVPQVDGKVVYIYYESLNLDTNVLNKTLKIVDDKSIEEPTLGLRRLRLLAQGVKLAKLGKAIFFLGDLVKLAKKNKLFIDSMGQVFTYTKKEYAKLTYIKIAKVTPISTGGALIEVEGIPSKFKCLFEPGKDKKYAGILKQGMSHILYGLYPYKYKDSRRMI